MKTGITRYNTDLAGDEFEAKDGVFVKYEDYLKEVKKLRKALGFYASGGHYDEHGNQNNCEHYADLENVSGEPINLLEGHCDVTIEDGTIAQGALDTENKPEFKKIKEWLEAEEE